MIRMNETGVVISPNLHDGHIVEIEISGKDLKIKCISIDGQSLLMTLVNVEDLEINRFWMGNVILNVLIMTRDQVTPETIAAIRVSEKPMELSSKAFGNLFDKVTSGLLKYVSISSSYGLTLQALCQEVSVREV